MNPKIVILDPSLKDERGHHYIFTSMISKAAVKLGFEVIWFVHKEFNVPNAGDGATVANVFSRTMYDQFTKKKSQATARSPVETPDVLGRIKSKLKSLIPIKFKVKVKSHLEKKQRQGGFLNELNEAIEQYKLGPKDHIIVHTADGDMYRGVLDLLSIPGFSAVSPILHLITPYDESIMPGWNKGLSVDRVINYLTHLNFINTKVFLYAENDLLAEHLSKLFKSDVESMNIPVESADLLAKPDVFKQNEKIQITYLGAAREEKGFLLLPELVSQCYQNETLKNRLKFTIQCTPQIIGYLPPISKAIEELKVFPNEFVELLDQKLTTAEYNARLEKADIVLNLYDKNKYRVRGSGIAVEAVSKGKIVIATANTFPAYVAGNVGIKVDSVEQAVEKLLSTVDQYQTTKNKAIDWANKYRRENQSDAYLLRFLSRHAASKQSKKVETPANNKPMQPKLTKLPKDITAFLTDLRVNGIADENSSEKQTALFKLINENPEIDD